MISPNRFALSLAGLGLFVVGAQANPTALTTEHVDVGLVEDGAFELHWHDEDNDVEYEPDEAFAVVPITGTISHNATDYYWLPQSQDPTKLFLGIGAEDSDGSFGAWNPGDSRIASGSFEWLRLNLVSVSGPGEFAMWSDVGDWMDTADGIGSTDVYYVLDGGHAHVNWGFTEIGTYELGFTVSGVLGGGTGVSTSDEVALFTFVVPEPTTAALVALGLAGLVGRRRRHA